MLISYLKLARFLLVSLGIVCGAHWLVYAALVRFGVVSDPGVKRALIWLLMIFGLSFIPSAAVLRIFPGWPARVLYFAAAFWLGFFIYLLLATLISLAVFGVGKISGVSPNMPMVFMACCIVAAAVSVYGFRCARYPALKTMDIHIKELPDAWRGKTVVQLSDVHLGSIRGPGFMTRVAELVNSVHPDLVLITGDLFDGMNGCDLADFIGPLNRLEARSGIYFVTGNHEGYLGLAKPLAILSETKIKVLDNDIVDINGLQVIGIPFPENGLKNDVRGLLTSPGTYDPGKPSILMYHTPTSIEEQNTDPASQQTNTYWRPGTDFTFAQTVGIDLQLSGHTHQGQFFPFMFLTRIIYNGYDYGLHRVGDFQIYITSGAGTWGPPIRIDCPPEIPVFRLHRS